MRLQQPKRETKPKIKQYNFDANMLGENYARFYCFIYEIYFDRMDSTLCHLPYLLHVLLLIAHFVIFKIFP